MQSIPTLFLRTERGVAVDDLNPECADLFTAGPGQATEKVDGTCCMVLKGRLYRRHRVREGRSVPSGWIHWSGPNADFGHGWLPVTDTPENQWHTEAWESHKNRPAKYQWLFCEAEELTCELVGPRIQKNPYGLEAHELWVHGMKMLHDAPTGFEGIKEYLQRSHIEGIVWWRNENPYAKIKRRDFGIPWPEINRSTRP